MWFWRKTYQREKIVSSTTITSCPVNLDKTNLRKRTTVHLLSLFYPGYTFSINDGCGWTSADLNKNLYYGNCGDSIFLENASDGWCAVAYSSSWVGDSGSIGLCLANSEADCCEVAPGPTAGIAIALILLLAGIIACICRCCRCFCFKSKAEAPQIVVVQAPAATASEK